MIEKIQKLNIPQRIWYFIVGKDSPNMLTQASVAVGFFVWLYFFSWHLLTFLTISLMGTLKNASQIEAAFGKVGAAYQGFMFGNVTSYLFVHSLAQFVVFGTSLVGLILIWRQKKLGFLLYIFSNAATYLVTFFILGTRYIINEVSLFDFLLLLLITLYFATGYWLFYKNKD